jgi:hypothetical protein
VARGLWRRLGGGVCILEGGGGDVMA